MALKFRVEVKRLNDRSHEERWDGSHFYESGERIGDGFLVEDHFGFEAGLGGFEDEGTLDLATEIRVDEVELDEEIRR